MDNNAISDIPRFRQAICQATSIKGMAVSLINIYHQSKEM